MEARMPTQLQSSQTAALSSRRFLDKSLPRLLLMAGLIVFSIIAIDLDHGQVGVVHDDGIYLVSAQSLSAGHGYRLPSRPGSPPPKYPIGLPGLIAIALRVARGPHSLARDSAVGRAVVIVFSLIFFVAAYRWLCRALPSRTAAALIVLCTAFHHVCLIGC